MISQSQIPDQTNIMSKVHANLWRGLKQQKDKLKHKNIEQIDEQRNSQQKCFDQQIQPQPAAEDFSIEHKNSRKNKEVIQGTINVADCNGESIMIADKEKKEFQKRQIILDNRFLESIEEEKEESQQDMMDELSQEWKKTPIIGDGQMRAFLAREAILQKQMAEYTSNSNFQSNESEKQISFWPGKKCIMKNLETALWSLNRVISRAFLNRLTAAMGRLRKKAELEETRRVSLRRILSRKNLCKQVVFEPIKQMFLRWKCNRMQKGQHFLEILCKITVKRDLEGIQQAWRSLRVFGMIAQKEKENILNLSLGGRLLDEGIKSIQRSQLQFGFQQIFALNGINQQFKALRLTKVISKFQFRQVLHGFQGLKTHWKGLNGQQAGMMLLARTFRFCVEDRKKEVIKQLGLFIQRNKHIEFTQLSIQLDRNRKTTTKLTAAFEQLKQYAYLKNISNNYKFQAQLIGTQMLVGRLEAVLIKHMKNHFRAVQTKSQYIKQICKGYKRMSKVLIGLFKQQMRIGMEQLKNENVRVEKIILNQVKINGFASILSDILQGVTRRIYSYCFQDKILFQSNQNKTIRAISLKKLNNLVRKRIDAKSAVFLNSLFQQVQVLKINGKSLYSAISKMLQRNVLLRYQSGLKAISIHCRDLKRKEKLTSMCNLLTKAANRKMYFGFESIRVRGIEVEQERQRLFEREYQGQKDKQGKFWNQLMQANPQKMPENSWVWQEQKESERQFRQRKQQENEYQRYQTNQEFQNKLPLQNIEFSYQMNQQAKSARTRADSAYQTNKTNHIISHNRKYPDNELKFIEIDSQHSQFSRDSSSTATSRNSSHLGVLRQIDRKQQENQQFKPQQYINQQQQPKIPRLDLMNLSNNINYCNNSNMNNSFIDDNQNTDFKRKQTSKRNTRDGIEGYNQNNENDCYHQGYQQKENTKLNRRPALKLQLAYEEEIQEYNQPVKDQPGNKDLYQGLSNYSKEYRDDQSNRSNIHPSFYYHSRDTIAGESVENQENKKMMTKICDQTFPSRDSSFLNDDSTYINSGFQQQKHMDSNIINKKLTRQKPMRFLQVSILEGQNID